MDAKPGVDAFGMAGRCPAKAVNGLRRLGQGVPAGPGDGYSSPISLQAMGMPVAGSLEIASCQISQSRMLSSDALRDE